MKFDVFGILLMIVAIAIGQVAADYLGSMFGLAGGIMGAVLAGSVAYLIFSLVTGGKLGVMNGVIFVVLIYIAQLAAAYIASLAGMASGYLTLILAGVIVSFVWGWIGGRKQGQTPVKVPNSGL